MSSAVWMIALLIAATGPLALLARRRLRREIARARLRDALERMTTDFRAVGELIGRRLIPPFRQIGEALSKLDLPWRGDARE